MIEVQTKDLRKGDHILQCSSKPAVSWTTWEHGGGVITTDVVPIPGDLFRFTYLSGVRFWPTDREGYLWWRVERVGVAAEPTQPVKKVIDPFPGKCEWCGEKAYVSALSVAHKDESSEKARKCPARRPR